MLQVDMANRAERLKRILQGIEGYDPADLIPSSIAYLPNPAHEAHQLIGMIGRHGTTAASLRALIDVAPHQAAYLRRVTARDPLKARVVEQMLAFRLNVRRCFDAELDDPALGADLPDAGEPDAGPATGWIRRR